MRRKPICWVSILISVLEVFYGGVGYNEQERLLEEGCDIVIGTPGRLIDFGKSGKIRFSEMGILVIDEGRPPVRYGFPSRSEKDSG